jgi:putative ABC transport system permease protein
MKTLIQDVGFGLRMLRKDPGFAVVAILTLALGIGANTVLFSIVNGVLLNPLPFPHPDQLVALGENKPNFENGSISFPNFRDWQKDNHSFSSIAVYRPYSFSLTGSGEAEQLDGSFVSSDLFFMLGVRPSVGRSFMPGEDEVGAAPVALISEGLWQRKFSSSPEILGKLITLDGKGYTVVGVVPASFHLNLVGFREGNIYVPVGQWSNPLLLNRGAGLGFHGIGRLKAGISVEQARADMDGVSQNLAAAYPDADQGITADLLPMKERMVGRLQPVLLLLLAGVGFVLLIACVNVANLMLARSSARSREFAIRAALGAGRSHVLRQLLTESVLLASLSGALGLLLAAWGTRAALAIVPSDLPRAEGIGLDLHVLTFTLAVSLLAGILFGLAPALRMSRPGVNETLKEGGRNAVGARHRTQNIFVVTEMALAMVLMIAAGLTVRSLARLWHVDPGFDPHHVLSFGLSLPPSMVSASADTIRANFRDLDRRLAEIPGVEAVSQSSGAVPLDYDDEQLFWLEGQPKPTSDNDMNWAIDYIVEPGYLELMKIPLRQGRFLGPRDDEYSPLVVVVDDVFAAKYFAGQDALGKRIHLKWAKDWAEIVGVVGHVNQWGLDSDRTQSLRAQLYLASMQMPDEYVKSTASTGMFVRSEADPSSVFAAVRAVNRQISSQQVIYSTETMDEIVSRSLATRRFSMTLLGIFAGLALVLASVGIYGVISYVVGQRVNEIGVRMALGAERGHILRLILGGGGKLTLAGVAVGLAAAFGLTRLMSSMLFEVQATDPLTFGGVAVLLFLVALAACYVPARRAAKLDPMVALRYE